MSIRVISIFKGKAKEWPSYFKKKFGSYGPNATFEDVVNKNKARVYAIKHYQKPQAK
jgi:hypothetical protein